jgi:hypothetical protein
VPAILDPEKEGTDVTRQQTDSPVPVVEVVPGHRPPEAVRDLAYQVWAWEAEENCAAVAHRLDVEPRTVQRWAKDDGWRLRKEEERAELTPANARYVTALVLGNAAPKAAAKLEAMIDGTIPPDKTMAAICQIVLDRTGFAPITLKEREPEAKPEPPKEPFPSHLLRYLTDAELLALERGLDIDLDAVQKREPIEEVEKRLMRMREQMSRRAMAGLQEAARGGRLRQIRQ